MHAVNMFDAKTNLSKYISYVEEKKEPFVVIMRNGKPVAKIVPFEDESKKTIGIAKGDIPTLSDLDAFNSIDCENDFVGDGGIQ